MWTGHQRGAGFNDINMEPCNSLRSERSKPQGQAEKESQEVRGGKMKKIQGKVVLRLMKKK